VIAILLASDPESSVLDLVSNAWAGFGAAFGPLILLSLFWRRMNRNGALAGMVVGAVTVIVWLYAPFTIMVDGTETALNDWLYAIVPGFIFSLIAVLVGSLTTAPPSNSITDKFTEMESKL